MGAGVIAGLGKWLNFALNNDTLVFDHIKTFPPGVEMCFTRSLLSLLFCAMTALPAAAQEDLSVEDLVEMWNKQKEVFHEAQSNGLGKTRGLELITIDDPGAGTSAAETGASVTATAQPSPTDPNEPLAATGETVQPVVFGQLDPDLQVNLQINFGFDSAALADTEKPKLQKICQAMQQSKVQLFRIVGHTDTAGTDEYNERLSVLRAKEVVRYLVEDCGIPAARLETMGMGERFPFNEQDPQADENRRVEFQALS